MKPHLSVRASQHGTLSEFSRLISASRSSAFDLTISNPASVGLGWDAQALSRIAASVDASRYLPEAMGPAEARAAVCEYLGLAKHAASRTMLTASTSEAYAFLFKLLADAGDEILVPSPSYPLFDYLAGYEGLRVVPYPLFFDGLWHIDLAELRARRTAKTRAIVVVSPNNPTGSLLSRDSFEAIDAMGLPVLADEVFREYLLEPRSDACLSALDEQPRSPWFVMGGLSKTAALPQWKLAWTVLRGGGDQAELWDALETIADTYLSVSAVAAHGLAGVLASVPPVQAALRARLRQNLELIDAALMHSSASRRRVEGGWSCLLRMPATRDDEAWATLLLREQKLLTQPGYFYELGPEPHLVLSLLTPPDLMEQGLARIQAVL